MNTLAVNAAPLVLPSDRPQVALGEPYLKVQLNAETAAVLLMKQVQEVMALPPNRLTPMPNLPACVMGLMSRRSQIMWAVDLAQLMGIQPAQLPTHPYSTVILQPQTRALGAIVQRIEGITWLTPEQIQAPPSHRLPALAAYIRGCVLREKEILLVLDAEAIVQSTGNLTAVEA